MSRRNRHFSKFDTIVIDVLTRRPYEKTSAFYDMPYGTIYGQLDPYHIISGLDYCEPESFYLRYDRGFFSNPFEI